MIEASNQKVYLKKRLNVSKQELEEPDIGVQTKYANKVARKRNITIINQTEYQNTIMRNQTVMDLSQKYVISNQLDMKVIYNINMA